MGKKQHSKDRMYLTTKEWKYEWGGFKEKQHLPFKRLPYHCCAISFLPFEDPVCTADGTVFDIVNIVPYVRKFGKHPVSGEPLKLSDLIKLNFSKNSDGEYQCPVLSKVFTEHTHIVAVKTTGNVYCWEAVEELNVKPKNWKDLLTDEPFTRKDIIHIQDPLSLQGKTIESFHHVKNDLSADAVVEEEDTSLRNMSDDMKRTLAALKTSEAQDAFNKGGGGKRAEMARMITEAKAKEDAEKERAAKKAADEKKKAAEGSSSQKEPAAGGDDNDSKTTAGKESKNKSTDPEGDWRLRGPGRDTSMPKFKPGALTWDTDDYSIQNANQKQKKQQGTAAKPAAELTPQERYETHVKYVEGSSTTGAMSRSFTSSVAAISTKNQRQLIRLYRNPTKKAYAQLHTNLGSLNLELHCDIVPRTCENFLGLAEMGYYDNTIFHRSIKNFMIQGGDPTGTGRGGESIYGKQFQDEVDSRLVHNGRGVLSMANSGPNTNGSQFFITYKSCRNLDYKHSVFGRVVGGFETLTSMERVKTDPEDRPKEEIRITGITVYVNPYKEMEEEEQKAAEEEKKKIDAPIDDPDKQVGKWYSNPAENSQREAVRSGVGKYISVDKLPAPAATAPAPAEAAGQPPAKKPKVAKTMLSNFDAW